MFNDFINIILESKLVIAYVLVREIVSFLWKVLI